MWRNHVATEDINGDSGRGGEICSFFKERKCARKIFTVFAALSNLKQDISHIQLLNSIKNKIGNLFIKQLLYPPDDYTGFTLSCPPTFYNKIAPMFIGDAEAGEVFTKRGN